MKRKIYYIREFDNISEGGISRDTSFYNEILKKEEFEIKFLKKSFYFRIIQSIKEIYFLLNIKNSEIFLHQSSINIIFPAKIFSTKYFNKIFKLVLNRLSLRNKIIIEMNDLPYEQSIDLELCNEKEREQKYKIQKSILGIKNVIYIFASEEMRKFSIRKYGVSEKNSYTCINGGRLLKKKKEILLEKDNKIKYIYAGTLNKGRQIEELIEIFENKTNKFRLILIGNGGEWIKEKKYKNIYYMGSYSEEEAIQIVSSCDIGLVPYDESRLYYNMCYPTKNSFYITAGIPILITPLEESINQLKKYDILFIEKLENWSNILNKITKEEIQKKKKKIKKIRNFFLWSYLINKVLKEII